ncbi:MAG: hypothetical protein VBE63_11650 [Lamprobacter sp.]|uniref:hypothetical protein n=1 Tax=Lamprobacter sp. TaxID=3100796 RepID=UPI002B25A5CE|nr:hypothetical protein [Lamprobacter sp.]MEA3640583.1 hypothetical protein [Lamprobacter sp.]
MSCWPIACEAVWQRNLAKPYEDSGPARIEQGRLMGLDVWYVPGLREVRDEILTPQRGAER